MGLEVATGKAAESNGLLGGLQRGRHDRQFFSRMFLNRTLHDGQLEYVENAEATLNCLATANRWGKTTVLENIHYHSCVYKTGGEERYLDEAGRIDVVRFQQLKYHTIHTAFEWETAALVWDTALKSLGESSYLDAFVRGAPKSKPPHIDFITGSRWKFRTLGHDAAGIDGNSFYNVSIDEAGWIPNLETLMANVIRVRVADVRGRVHIVGTFKPGVSKDFYKACVRASAYTGRALGFDHRDDPDALDYDTTLDSSIRKYLREYGIDLDEYAEALAG